MGSMRSKINYVGPTHVVLAPTSSKMLGGQCRGPAKKCETLEANFYRASWRCHRLIGTQADWETWGAVLLDVEVVELRKNIKGTWPRSVD